MVAEKKALGCYKFLVIAYLSRKTKKLKYFLTLILIAYCLEIYQS
jgi:hypothetical protein